MIWMDKKDKTDKKDKANSNDHNKISFLPAKAWLEEGKDYRTRGGWKATVVHVATDKLPYLERHAVVVHKKGTSDERVTHHYASTGKVEITLAVLEAPHYDGHPADIVKEWDDDANEDGGKDA